MGVFVNEKKKGRWAAREGEVCGGIVEYRRIAKPVCRKSQNGGRKIAYHAIHNVRESRPGYNALPRVLQVTGI